MWSMIQHSLHLRSLAAALLLSTSAALANPEGPAFKLPGDVDELLDQYCYSCHDEDVQKGDLRLDTEEGALAVIVRGDAVASEMISRIFHHDPDELMPPPESSRSLSQQERNTLKRWIEQGAPWQQHWSFEKVVKPAGQGIDDFVQRKLKEQTNEEHF